MNTLEWNPAFAPLASSLIILAAGAYFYFLLQHLRPRYGTRNAWLLLFPKMVVVALILLALLDPDLKMRSGHTTPAKVLILQDISSSMDLKDDDAGTRTQRADRLIHELEGSSPDTIKFEVLPFDTLLHPADYKPKTADERGTDLAAVIEALAINPKFADADGAVLVTDGGDETVELSHLPTIPFAIVGVGASPDLWNDIGIGNVTAPASVEEKSQFDLEADLYARPATPGPLNSLKVALDEGRDKQWTEVQSQTVDLSSQHAAAIFHVQVDQTGALRYRVRLPQLPGELTYANAGHQHPGATARPSCPLLHAGTRGRLQVPAQRAGHRSRRRFHRHVPRAGKSIHRPGGPHRL
jgi:hypothetical protein